MNAMAHAVESLYGIDTNPVVETMAEEAVRLLGLEPAAHRAKSARSRCAHRCALRRLARGEFPRRVGLEHAIAQRVRQWFDLDHAQTHAISTPYAVGFNADAAPNAMARIKRALDADRCGARALRLNVRLGLPTGLKTSGCAKTISPRPSTWSQPSKSRIPKPVVKADLANVIGQAYAGEPPRF